MGQVDGYKCWFTCGKGSIWCCFKKNLGVEEVRRLERSNSRVPTNTTANTALPALSIRGRVRGALTLKTLAMAMAMAMATAKGPVTRRRSPTILMMTS